MVLLCALGLAIWSLRNSGLRMLALAYVLVPVIFCIFVSLFIRPIWLYRTIAYTLPFWCIAIAFILYHTGPSNKRKAGNTLWRYGLIVIALSLFGYATYTQQTWFARNPGVEDAARFLQSVARPGDVIYAPSERVFWGLGWYLVGPGSVNPITTSHILGTRSGLTLVSNDALTALLDETRDWIVYRSIAEAGASTVVQPNTAVWDFHDVQVVRWER